MSGLIRVKKQKNMTKEPEFSKRPKIHKCTVKFKD